MQGKDRFGLEAGALTGTGAELVLDARLSWHSNAVFLGQYQRQAVVVKFLGPPSWYEPAIHGYLCERGERVPQIKYRDTKSRVASPPDFAAAVTLEGMIVMERILPGTPLWSLGWPAARKLLPGALAALRRMHGLGVVHGDAHLGNCLRDGDAGACWIDFEFSHSARHPLTPELAACLGPTPPQGPADLAIDSLPFVASVVAVADGRVHEYTRVYAELAGAKTRILCGSPADVLCAGMAWDDLAAWLAKAAERGDGDG
jgi:hypothetical protein